jgi:hypothetical protein
VSEQAEQAARIDFRRGDGDRRSSAAAGRAVVAAALAEADEAGALAARQETAWRSNYLLHFRRLVEAGLASPSHWVESARAGLDELAEQMVLAPVEAEADGADLPLEALRTRPGGTPLRTETVRGEAAPEGELVLPYRGDHLRGDDLRRRLDAWIAEGVLEPSAADAVREVMAHPEWLRLDGQTVAVLGAGAEMGPLSTLLRWGATVAGVDLPRPDLWRRVLEAARRGAGTLLLPTRSAGSSEAPADLAERAGADLLAEVPEVGDWLTALPGPLTVGNYVYADGATHVRVATAVDVVIRRLLPERDDVTLASLATPTDVFVVPREAVAQSVERYAGRSALARTVGRPLRTLTRGRLLRRAYPADAELGISDALVPVQGPNYALAKRVQRWRAALARAEGVGVSFHVAPSSRTRSVLTNRALAAAYAGAHRFGVEIFEPETANTLMAALLVHDLQAGIPTHQHPWQDEAFAAVHGGLWRTPYAPRSALGLAAVLGYAAVRP